MPIITIRNIKVNWKIRKKRTKKLLRKLIQISIKRIKALMSEEINLLKDLRQLKLLNQVLQIKLSLEDQPLAIKVLRR